MQHKTRIDLRQPLVDRARVGRRRWRTSWRSAWARARWCSASTTTAPRTTFLWTRIRSRIFHTSESSSITLSTRTRSTGSYSSAISKSFAWCLANANRKAIEVSAKRNRYVLVEGHLVFANPSLWPLFDACIILEPTSESTSRMYWSHDCHSVHELPLSHSRSQNCWRRGGGRGITREAPSRGVILMCFGP